MAHLFSTLFTNFIQFWLPLLKQPALQMHENLLHVSGRHKGVQHARNWAIIVCEQCFGFYFLVEYCSTGGNSKCPKKIEARHQQLGLSKGVNENTISMNSASPQQLHWVASTTTTASHLPNRIPPSHLPATYHQYPPHPYCPQPGYYPSHFIIQ